MTVIGAGTMGRAMAGRLLDRHLEVGVWDRRPEAAAALAGRDATVYPTAAEAVGQAEVVLTMLATSQATEAVMLEGRALEAMAPGAVWAQMATIGIEASQRLAGETRRRRSDVTFVDAPVSGSREPAERGQLLVLASGPAAPPPPLEPVFAALGRKTLWLGRAGAGSRMKLVLNTWLAFQTEGAAEALALVRRLGIPAEALRPALEDNPLSSPYALAKLGRMLEADYEPDFSLAWALKDLDLVGAEAGRQVAPVTAAIADRWRQLVDRGLGGLDVSVAGQGEE